MLQATTQALHGQRLPLHDTVWDTVMVVQRAVTQVKALEPTVGTLGIWWTAIGVMVAALGVLFAAGAIVSGVLLWRQSSDYKKKVDATLESLNEAKDLVTGTVEDANAQIAAAIDKVQAAAAEAEGRQRESLEDLAHQLAELPKAGSYRSFLDRIERLQGDPRARQIAHDEAVAVEHALRFGRSGEGSRRQSTRGGDLMITAINDVDRRAVNLTAVRGPISVELLVRLPSDVAAQGVDILLDGTVVCSQALGGLELTDVPVSSNADAWTRELRINCLVQTDMLNASGRPAFANGPHTLTARLVASGGSVKAAVNQALVFDNLRQD